MVCFQFLKHQLHAVYNEVHLLRSVYRSVHVHVHVMRELKVIYICSTGCQKPLVVHELSVDL